MRVEQRAWWHFGLLPLLPVFPEGPCPRTTADAGAALPWLTGLLVSGWGGTPFSPFATISLAGQGGDLSWGFDADLGLRLQGRIAGYRPRSSAVGAAR